MRRQLAALIVVLALALTQPFDAQSIPTWPDHTTLWQFWSAQKTRIPGEDTNAYKALSRRESQTLGLGLLQLAVKDVTTARTTLNRVGMELYSLVDTGLGNRQYYVVREIADPGAAGFKGLGTYVVDPGATRNILILNSHPIFDENSWLIARRFFEQSRGVLLGMNGVHRCNSTTNTTCDGTFTGCSTTGYKISDAAHSDTHPFFAVYEFVAQALEVRHVIELHQMGDGSEPVASLATDGTTANTTTGLSHRLRQRLTGNGLFTVASCNTAADDGLGLGYCGQTNLGGRLLNGVAARAACTDDAVTASGRFLQVENRSVVIDTYYQTLIDALLAEIPVDR